jgi:hypothetical protein
MIMFNDLDNPFRLLNLRYQYEAHDILYFINHHTLFKINNKYLIILFESVRIKKIIQ